LSDNSRTHRADTRDGLAGGILADRYEIRDRIDESRLSTVHLAWDRQEAREVAIKLPSAGSAADDSARERIRREIKSRSALHHPSILPLIDAKTGDRNRLEPPYAVFPYLRGGSLRDRIESVPGSRLTREAVLEWLPAIAEALDTMHRSGWLHRDVTPQNILFDANRTAFLADFGTATTLHSHSAARTARRHPDEPTQRGRFTGSSAYVPPEAIDHRMTPAYDQYSLATVVFRALSGALPFSGGGHEEILIAREKNRPPRIPRTGLKAPLPAYAERAVRKALSRRPENRFASCMGFVRSFAGERPAPSDATG
jgi:serine/threonine-protein kinase